MAPIVFTPKVKFLIAITVILGLIATGIWIERGQQAKKEVKQLTAQADFSDVRARKLDSILAEKTKTEGAAQKELNRALEAQEKAEHENPEYRDYLDTPIPAESRELYRRAGAIRYEPPGSDGADGKRGKEDRGPRN